MVFIIPHAEGKENEGAQTALDRQRTTLNFDATKHVVLAYSPKRELDFKATPSTFSHCSFPIHSTLSRTTALYFS